MTELVGYRMEEVVGEGLWLVLELEVLRFWGELVYFIRRPLIEDMK